MSPPADEGAQTKGAQTRLSILAAAIARFGRDGFRSTSVADIARDAGVGGTVAYAYFPNKEALFLAAVDEDAAAVIEEGLATVTEVPDIRGWHETLVFTLVDAVERHPLARRLLAGLEPEVTGRVLEIPALNELRKECTERLRTGQATGDVRPDIDPVLVGNGVVALMLSVLMSVTQLGSRTAMTYSADVAAVFEAALIAAARQGLSGQLTSQNVHGAGLRTGAPIPRSMTLTLTLNFLGMSSPTVSTANGRARGFAAPTEPSNYRWIALATVTLGTLMVFINQSIVLISLPDIFRGIGLNPLTPGNTGYLLWMLLGFMVVLAVLVVSLGRVGDMFGRVKIFNLGFAVFTVFSILLAVTWLQGTEGALWLIVMRIGQGVGGAMLFANSSAIITDAFPADKRGLGLGINNTMAIAGSFVGLVLGGLLAPVEWHLVFLVSVPVGILGTLFAYVKLVDHSVRVPAKIDWLGNSTFAVGLILILIGITYGLLPYGGHTMGWTSPVVLAEILGGIAILLVFGIIETKVAHPMFRLQLFRIRAFTAGNVASFLASMSRGGLMFMLVIWLQGIWLPLHGYSFEQTPLWAGIYMIPLTIGLLLSAPLSGLLADRYGARPFATGGLVIAAITFVLLITLPVNFPYALFGVVIFFNSVGMGMFVAPNQTGIMNSLPANQRGSGAGMAGTFNSSAQVLSIGIFFTLMILGLAASLPGALFHGLTAQGVPAAVATKASHLPPVGSLFAAFLGYNPVQVLLGPTALGHLPHATASYVTSRQFFPHLIAQPFHKGLTEAFAFAAAMCLLGAVASLLRGGKYHYEDDPLMGDEITAEGAGHVSAQEAVAETEPLLVD